MSELSKRGFTTGSESFNRKNNTIEVIFASETPVRRRGWEGPFDEILIIDKSAIDVTRLNSGSMSLLNNHDAFDMDSRLGVVLPNSLRIEGGNAYCRVQLSQDRAETIISDLNNGMPFAVSVGYKISEFSIDEADIPKRQITHWEPVEISAVPIPADPTAQTRKENSMPEIETNPKTNTISTRKEKVRVETIEAFADRFGENYEGVRERADLAILNNTSSEEFREELQEIVYKATDNIPSHFAQAYDGRNQETIRQEQTNARAEALACRITGNKASDNARNFMNMSLSEHARSLVESRGENTRLMGADQILRRAHATGHFPMLLKATGHRILTEKYQLSQSPLKSIIARSSNIDDFRAKSVLKISDIGELKKVNEGGEITATTRSEASEGYSLETFARMFKMTRQAIINDDLGAFTDFNHTAGRMAAETENKLLFDLLTQNSGRGIKLMETNKSIFHNDHNNLSTGTSSILSASSLSTARKKMRQQKALDGNTFVNAAPKYLMVGPELETLAEQLIASVTPNTIEGVNPFAGKLELLVEPRIENNNWYLFANPSIVPTLEYSYLTSQPGVQIDVEESFDTLGTSFRVYLDFGAGALDYRGAHLGEGQ